MKPSTMGRKLAALRKHHGGPPRKPTPCARCGAQCESVTAARLHCRRPRKAK